jgi:hypothetical protein
MELRNNCIVPGSKSVTYITNANNIELTRGRRDYTLIALLTQDYILPSFTSMLWDEVYLIQISM